MCYSLVGNSESNLLFAFASRDPRPDSNDCLPSLIDYSIPRSNVPILILQPQTGDWWVHGCVHASGPECTLL